MSEIETTVEAAAEEVAPVTLDSLSSDLRALLAERDGLVAAYDGVQGIIDDLASNEVAVKAAHQALADAGAAVGMAPAPLVLAQPSRTWVSSEPQTKYSAVRAARLAYIRDNGPISYDDAGFTSLVDPNGTLAEGAVKNILRGLANAEYVIKSGRGDKATFAINMDSERVQADFAYGSEE